MNEIHCRSAAPTPGRATNPLLALLLLPTLAAGCATTEEAAAPFDYVVVGAGAAGSVLAHRLTEDPGTRVLVLEAGGPDDDPRIRRPSAFRQLLETPFNQAFTTAPEPGLDDREISWPRGRGWGGSGSISAMVYVRGHASDFDRWERAGNPGWGYDDVLPYFKKAENQERGPSEYHGVGGPQNVADPRWVSPLSEAFVEAALQVGLPRNEDFNGPRQEGVGLYQVNQKNGERHSAADAYLRPALGRSNLTVESRARVTRVLFEGPRAVGVAYVRDGRPHEARAAREVILSAGTIGSAQLLLLSGIGPAEPLRALGIPVIADLPGVGENLQDHPRVAITYASRQPLELSDAEQERAEREYAEARTGPLASNGIGAGAFVRISPDDPAPAVQIMLTANPAAGTFSVHAALMHPASRGTLRLRTADPGEPPILRARLSHRRGGRGGSRRGPSGRAPDRLRRGPRGVSGRGAGAGTGGLGGVLAAGVPPRARGHLLPPRGDVSHGIGRPRRGRPRAAGEGRRGPARHRRLRDARSPERRDPCRDGDDRGEGSRSPEAGIGFPVYDPGAMSIPTRSPVQEIVGRLVGRLRYPWVFALLVFLFVADLLVPDPIPFVDEALLALLTFLVGSWGSRKKGQPEGVDVSPSARGGSPPESGG